MDDDDIMDQKHQMDIVECQPDEIELENYYVPNWLVEVLAWIERIEMANSSLPTASRLFKILCWHKLHTNVRPHIVSELKFCHIHEVLERSEFEGYYSCRGRNFIPIASVPPPFYILGFKKIWFGFLDAKVLKFVKNILHLLPFRYVEFEHASTYKADKITQVDLHNLMRMLTSEGTMSLLRWEMNHKTTVDEFNVLYPGIMDNVHHFENNWQPIERFKWLTQGKSDENVKYCLFGGGIRRTTKLVELIREEFCNSKQPRTFFIYLGDQRESCLPFTMENDRTGEVLCSYFREFPPVLLYPRPLWPDIKHYLVRCPKGALEELKKEGERQSLCSYLQQQETNGTVLRLCQPNHFAQFIAE